MARVGHLFVHLSLVLCCLALSGVNSHGFVIESQTTDNDVLESMESVIEEQAAKKSPNLVAVGAKGLMDEMVKDFKERAPKAVQKAICDHIKGIVKKLVEERKLKAVGGDKYRAVRPGAVTMATIFHCKVKKGSPAHKLMETIKLHEITVKCTPLDISVTSIPFDGVITIIPRLLKVDKLSLTAMLPNNLQPSIIVKGTMIVSNQAIQVEVMYTFSKDGEFVVSASTQLPALKVKRVFKKLTGLMVPLPSSVKFLDNAILKLKGTFSKSLEGDLLFEIQLKSGHKIFAILQRGGGKTKAAVGADVAKIRLSQFIHSISRKNIASVPFLGSLVLPELGVTLSKETITSQLVQEQFKNTRLLKYFDDDIPPGLTTYIRSDSLKALMKVAVNSEQMSLTVQEGTLTVRKFLNKIPRVNVNRIPLPPGFAHIWDIRLKEIGYSFKEKLTFLEFSVQKTLSYFGGIIKIMNPTVRLEITPKGVTVEANGYITIAGTKFTVRIAKNDDGVYYLDASSARIPIGSLLHSFHTKFVPPQFNSIAGSMPLLKSFAVKNFKIVLVFDKKTPQVYLSGKPEISGYSPLKISAALIRQRPNKIVTVLEIDLGKTSLAKLLGQLSPRAAGALRRIPMLNWGISVTVLISPQSVQNVKLSQEISNQINAPQGITVRSKLRIPQNCRGDKFCLVLQRILSKKFALNLEASIVSTTDFRMFAGISGDITLIRGLTLRKAGLELKVAGGVTSIGIVGTIAISKPRLDFTGRIFLTSLGEVIFEMTMAGCWNSAFGIPILDVCNIHASFGFGPSTGLTEIAYGMKVRLGIKRCRRPIEAAGYVGINTVNPNQNYYYAKLHSGMSLAVLLRAMCINPNAIPKPIRDSGLKPGAMFSFSIAGKSIPEIKLNIPAGLQVNGKFSILGYVISANIKINPTQGIYVSLTLPPLTAVRGALKVYRTPRDKSHGPRFIADIGFPNRFKVEACGFIEVLKMSVQTCMTMDINRIYFKIQGNILNVLKGSLTFYTRNGFGPFFTRAFQCRGEISGLDFGKLINPVWNAVNHVAKTAGRIIGKAFNHLRHRLNLFQNANRLLDKAKHGLRVAQNKVNHARNRVNWARNRVNSICHYRRCGRKCIIPRCGCSRRGWRIRCGCSGCYRSITDPICWGRNKACRVLKFGASKVLNAASHFLGGVGRLLGGARRFFHHAQRGLHAARNAYNHASKHLRHIKHVYRKGKNLLDHARRGISNVIALERLVVEAPLANAMFGKFHASITARFLGKRLHLSIGVDFKNIIGSIIRPIANRFGIGRLIRGRK